MHLLLKEVRHNPLLWLLVFVPALFVAEALASDAHTLLFVLSVLAIVPLAALLSHATESVAARTGDTVGGLLNSTLGNLTELVIAVAALRAVNAQFAYVNIFEDPEIREGLKAYSNWPTFPQLYVNGELIGGCDITLELFQSGELAKIVAAASPAQDAAGSAAAASS